MVQSGTNGGYYVSDFYSSFSSSRKVGDGSYRFSGRKTGVSGVLKVEHQREEFVAVLGHNKGLPWCDIVTDVGDGSWARIYNTYRADDTHILPSKMLVSLAIKKRGKSQRNSEGCYGE
jgi:hypothetical protein